MATSSAPNTLQLIPAGARVGKYEIVGKIASGGMAEIYLARVSGIQGFSKHVVLKRILPQYAANDEFVKMFLREARVAATLDQGNIAHVHDIGELGGGYFYTMEYLHGEDLRTIMKSLVSRKERLPLEHALGIALGVASGLHYAHEKKGPDGRSLGIVHRDISPSNVVVTFPGDVKIVDFGIAKVSADPDLSVGNAPKGKVSYMSPEQLDGQPVDRRSDVFSLGVVLYEITTHKRLFSSMTDLEVMRTMLKGAIPPPSTHDPAYPPDLEAIVMHALETDPDKRYPTARELERDLEAFVRLQRVPVSTTSMAEWMEQAFGPKREPWHVLPSLPPPPPPPRRTANTEKAAWEGSRGSELIDITRRAKRDDVIVLPEAEVQGGGETPEPIAIASVPTEKGQGTNGRVVAAGLGAFALLLALVGGAVGFSRARPTSATTGSGAEPATAAPVVMLVTESGHVAVEAAPPASAAVAPFPAATAPEVSPPARPARVPSAPGRSATRSTAATTASLSASLARRERDIRACLERHPSHAANTDEISFRFTIRAEGRVTSTEVLPEAVGASELGACLRGVGNRTVFAPQSAAMTFRIPLSLRIRQPEPRR